MSDINQIKQDELKIIADFNSNEVMHILDSLVTKYCLAYVDKDFASCKSLISFIHDIILMFEDDMEYLQQYTNYSMLKHTNHILKTIFKCNYDLEYYGNINVKSTTGLRNLANTLKKAEKRAINKVDKINIKHLHDMCIIGETIDENMVEVVNALYTSFNSKDNDDGADTIASGDC